MLWYDSHQYPFLFSFLPITERKVERLNLIFRRKNNPECTFTLVEGGGRCKEKGQPAGFHLYAIILCLVYTIKLQSFALILTVTVCLTADSIMSHP